MSEVEFKVGDLVYCPSVLPNVFKLLEVYDSQLKVKTPLRLVNIDRDIAVFLTSDGFDLKSKIPVIFHATQENYELLSKLYPNVTFEPPPKRKEPKEIIKAMLKAGYDGVPCKTECGRDRYICTGIVEDEFYSFQYDSDEDSAYSSGIPYHPKTGLKIVDFVDGEVILESENANL